MTRLEKAIAGLLLAAWALIILFGCTLILVEEGAHARMDSREWPETVDLELDIRMFNVSRDPSDQGDTHTEENH